MARSQNQGMRVGLCRLRLRLADNHSLKAKRQVVRSLTNRVKSRFNVAIAEVEDLDDWQRATLGFSCVSNDARHANEVISRVVAFIEGGRFDAEILDYEIEIVHPF